VRRRGEGNVVHYAVADPEFVSICRSLCVQLARASIRTRR